MRAPQQIKVTLTAASERRAALHEQMVRGDITVDRHRELRAFEDRWIDRCLDELLRTRTAP
jgi:hypothetical protein